MIAAVFVYTTIANIIERPDGIKIASFFIFVIIATIFHFAGDALDRDTDREDRAR